jgi:urea transport system permease protein
VVVFGGAQACSAPWPRPSDRADAVHGEFFLTGSMAKVLTLSAVILILMLRPQGLFSAKVRK